MGKRVLVLVILVGCTAPGGGGKSSGSSTTGSGGGQPECTVPGPGDCPNACAGGWKLTGAACDNTGECACPNFCKAGVCAPYEGQFTACTCYQPPAANDVVDTTDLVDNGPDGGTGTDLGDSDDGGTSGDPADVGPLPVDAGPVDIFDCAKAPPEGAPCNPYCQLGCGVGEHCTYVGSGAFGCLPIGPVPLDGQCEAFTDCATATGCFGLTGDPTATCHKLCLDNTTCPGKRPCDLTVNFGGGVTVTVCASANAGCNPFADECPEGTCYLDGSGGAKCLAEGTLGQGEICDGKPPNSCAPGLHCAVACQPLCNTHPSSGDQPKCDSTCASGQSLEIASLLSAAVCLTAKAPAACDAHAQTGCPPLQGCYLITGGFGCAPAGNQSMGEQCLYTNDCAPGTICTNGTCSQLCNLAANAPPDQACNQKCASHEIVVPAIWNIGVCAL